MQNTKRKATYGLGSKSTQTKKKDETVLDKTSDIAHARIEIYHTQWYASEDTPSLLQQGLLIEQN